ncbi:MAG: hypothetical protein EBZ86_09065 [Synechococcaceae bacterium WB9_2_069]|nr:hypothetical protein [Synechococcaceae bacterium WB9_2_069]
MPNHRPTSHGVVHKPPTILAWVGLIFISLATALSLMGASRPLFALVAVGLILVLSLPFLVFAFTTTLLNHIALEPREQSSSNA